VETVGIIGMIFAIAALQQISKLKQQVETLKRQLKESGVIDKQA